MIINKDKTTELPRTSLLNNSMLQEHKIALFRVDTNGYRFICAVSDFATHAKPLRETASYRDNLFQKTLDGHPLIDKAHLMLKSAYTKEAYSYGD